MDIRKFLAEVARNQEFIKALDAKIEKLAREYALSLKKNRQDAKRYNDALSALDLFDVEEGGWTGLKAFNAGLDLDDRLRLIDETLETISDEALTFWDLEAYWKTPEAKRAVMSNLWDVMVTTALGGERGAARRFHEAVSDVS